MAKKEQRTDEELQQLASDLFHGKIFTTQHKALADNPEAISRVFMPIIFFKPKDRKKFWDSNPGMIFEYLDKAGSRSCNGLPSFFSLQYLDQEETKKVWEIFLRLKEAEKTVMEQPA